MGYLSVWNWFKSSNLAFLKISVLIVSLLKCNAFENDHEVFGELTHLYNSNGNNLTNDCDAGGGSAILYLFSVK